MANILRQTVVQLDLDNIPKRVVVQYKDDTTDISGQSIVNYDDLTTEEKAIFDAYQSLCESKMV